MIKYFYIFFLIQFILQTNFLHSQSNEKNLIIKKPLIESDTNNLDVKIFRSINNIRNPFLDEVIYHTDIACIPISLSTPLLLFTVSKLNDNFYDESSAALLTLSEFTTITTTFIIKEIVKRERPYKKLKNVKHSKDDEIFLDNYSFPSGHASISFCLATSISLRYPDKPLLIAGLYTYSTVVAFGRIYIGVHYPSDVLAGAIIGTSYALLIYSLRKEIIGNFDKININNPNNSSQSLIFLSLAITEAINYLMMRNKINATSQFIFNNNEKLFRFSYSF
ncbi:MAG: phosphatase PAP2 family protein [Ignavibacteria bacterium]|nr:phosphatase PAP2 family protein [Ignavibacteria bacterium]